MSLLNASKTARQNSHSGTAHHRIEVRERKRQTNLKDRLGLTKREPFEEHSKGIARPLAFLGLGFGVWGLGFRVWGLGFRV